MASLAPAAPYDSLATVTQTTRTALADYVQGINPLAQGTVSTNGTAVTWLSGTKFSYLFNGILVTIAGVQYPVASVNGPTSLTLLTTAGVQVGKAYTAALPTGDIFSDSQAYVVPTVNLAWRKLQKMLADKGHPRLIVEIDLFSIPATTNLDPISQQWINWTEFYDGTNILTSPVLPPDFLSPLRLWERPAGYTARLAPMHPAGDGLRSYNKGSYNRWFDWRDDAIYLPGSILLMDMRVRYAAFLADLVPGQTSFEAIPVPIMRCADALAYYAAETFVIPRGGLAIAPTYSANGDAAVDQITNSFAKLQQRSSFHRRAWGERGRRRGGGIFGW